MSFKKQVFGDEAKSLAASLGLKHEDGFAYAQATFAVILRSVEGHDVVEMELLGE